MEVIAPRWGVAELVFMDETPFEVPARVDAVFTSGDRSLRVPGFWDGGPTYRVRFSPPEQGDWTFELNSTSSGLHGRSGVVRARGEAERGGVAHGRGPVSVSNRYHFAHADGSPYRPVGATVYNWLHQPDALFDETLDALRTSGFNKVRFLVWPQGGAHVERMPVTLPFARHDGGWDPTRPDPVFFRKLDRAVSALADAGIQADIILLHPYDEGAFGLDAMSIEQDEAYVRYVIARVGAYANVWWSLANEFDKMRRPHERWDALFRFIQDTDAHDRLRSIQNWVEFYDHNKPWVTHASIQNGAALEQAGRAVLYRDAIHKPVVLDEIKYEGDIIERWGRLSGPELVHRFWIAAASGVYAGHGESFLKPSGTLHIVEGGAFEGESPPRLAFLRGVLESFPADLDPIDKWHDESSTVGRARGAYLTYLGRHAPLRWSFTLPQGNTGERVELGDRFRVSIIDTWNMTVEPIEEVFQIDYVQRNFVAANGWVPLRQGAALALLIERVS